MFGNRTTSCRGKIGIVGGSSSTIAGAVWANKGDDFPDTNVQVNLIKGPEAPEVFAQVFYF